MNDGKLRIVVTDCATIAPANDVCWNALKTLGDVSLYERTALSDIIARCADADCVLTNKVPFDAVTLSALPKLRYIGVLATGYNIVDTAAAAKAGIIVTNIPAYSTASVAQHAISLLLAAVNNISAYAADSANGVWCKCSDFSYLHNQWHELAGKVFGVVGFGNTGSATAAIAAALGMHILVATSKSSDALPAGYEKATDIDDVFKRADVVSLHCPLTADTKWLVNSARLALMKQGSILVNTSRGPVVDERAIADALYRGKLGAFCADVLSTEPPAADNPLMGAPRAIITPHIAWASVEAKERLMNIALKNIEAFASGNPINKVN